MKRLQGLPIVEQQQQKNDMRQGRRSDMEPPPFDAIDANAPIQLKKTVRALLEAGGGGGEYNSVGEQQQLENAVLALVGKYTLVEAEYNTVLEKITSIISPTAINIDDDDDQTPPPLSQHVRQTFEIVLKVVRKQQLCSFQPLEHAEDLNRNLCLHPVIARNLTIVRNKMDGSSLYYAVSLALFGNHTYMRILRLLTVYMLVKDQQRYKDYLAAAAKNADGDKDDDDVDEFLLTARRIMKMHEYPNDMIVDALATAVGRRIYMYSTCFDSKTKKMNSGHTNDVRSLQQIHNNRPNQPGYFYYYGSNKINKNSQPVCIYYEAPYFLPMLPLPLPPPRSALLKPKKYGLQQGQDPIVKGTPKRGIAKDIPHKHRSSKQQQQQQQQQQHSKQQPEQHTAIQRRRRVQQQQQSPTATIITPSTSTAATAAAFSERESDQLNPEWADRTYKVVLDSATFKNHKLTSNDILQIINRLIRYSYIALCTNTWQETVDYCTKQDRERCKQFLAIARSLSSTNVVYSPRLHTEEPANIAHNQKITAKETLHPLILQELVPIDTPGDGNW